MIKWRKSTHSGTGQSDCVELAALEDDLVGVRDSKAPDAGHLALPKGTMAGVLNAIKAHVIEDRTA